MTQFDDEREVSRLYRELPEERPSARLDDAIRAEARWVAGTVPAPLVAPTGRRRWYFPLAAAAVIVLAVAVTWHVEREQPDAYVAEPVGRKHQARESAQAPRDAVVPLAKEQEAKVAEEAPSRLRQEPAAAAAPAAPAPRVDEARPQLGEVARSEMAQRRVMAVKAPETPEQWLERIAKLRAEGRHEDADRELAEFRKRYPDFRITPETLERVEKK